MEQIGIQQGGQLVTKTVHRTQSLQPDAEAGSVITTLGINDDLGDRRLPKF
ncbi:MAG: hypothetical protein OXE94_03980 [Aestuariivita sp.]|nr:hypothetical protein [Aestuariivita sp.]MCY4202588.1 hypothetical protein [Aestuariivita sp.]